MRSYALVWLLLLTIIGCQKLSMRSQSPDDDEEIKEGPKTTFIGDQVTIAGLHGIQVEGVGLVTGLDGTGGDTPPSLYRTMLKEDMRKRDVKQPEQLLQSPGCALVLIRASLPATLQYGEHFDLEVVLPDNTDASSLAGGWLLDAYLAEHAIVPGRGAIAGDNLAKASGPILLSISDGVSIESALRRGRILGGGVYIGGKTREDRKLGLYLRNEYRSVRNSKQIADRIGKRFHGYEHGIKKSMATAKTDQYIELEIPSRYKENYVRYIHVIRHMARRETPVAERERMERLRKSLMVPQTASRSAMELEGIGSDAIPVLKEGLHSPLAEVRFYSADALAYLGDGSGVEELARAVRDEPAFRVFALAALATLDEGSTHELLRRLMDEQSLNLSAEDTQDLTKAKIVPASWEDRSRSEQVNGAETRYGAFRALLALDKRDPFIRGEQINKQFNLHVLDTEGTPLIHLTRHRIPEIVLFGAQQEFRTPVALSAGRHIIINGRAGSDFVTVSRYEANKPDQQRVIRPPVIANVIRAVGELGGTYPDCAQMLSQALRQANLSGRLEVDAMPQGGRVYYRPSGTDSEDTEKTRIGKEASIPNMFPALKKVQTRQNSQTFEDTEEIIDNSGEASLSDDSTEADAEDDGKKPGVFGRLFKGSDNDGEFLKKGDAGKFE